MSEPMESIEYRATQAFQQLAKSICVLSLMEDIQDIQDIQDRQERRHHASVATAVCNLANTPPSLLVCIEKTASLARLLVPDAKFAVNVLGADQGAIVGQCMSVRGEARFEVGNWSPDEGELRYLQDAQANLFCRVAKLVEFDTHHIVIARILDAESADSTNALVYLGGKFVPFTQD